MLNDIETFQDALAVSGLPPVLSKRHNSGDFQAGVMARELGPLRLIELNTPAGECFRDARCARAEDEALWQVELVTRGRARVEQGGSTAELGPADMVLVDPARPVQYASTACTHVTLLASRRELRLRPADADRLAGVRIQGDRGPAALVSALVRDTVQSLAGFRADEAQRSGAAVIELILVALESQLHDVRPASDEVLRGRILGYIEARLSDQDLAPAKIATAHHISVRRLHRVFEDQALSVAAHIRRRRLERCRADLVRGDRTVAAVAARWGFADPSHFSRLFKATYGSSASALMSNSHARTVNAPTGRPGDDGGVTIVER
ncbi:helix-turn-helix domain-containing protein [Streptomyces sp. NBC_00414]|uniref:helix-turn-helix domain-containing protein n=1 Tax=Streptomyces sp. NBC_00414 TaxID=2975739 RepID=UPI002E213825